MVKGAGGSAGVGLWTSVVRLLSAVCVACGLRSFAEASLGESLVVIVECGEEVVTGLREPLGLNAVHQADDHVLTLNPYIF